MKRTALILIALLLPGIASAEKIVIQLSATEGLLIESSAPISVERIPIKPIGTPIVVDPIDPPDPSLTFEAASKKAIDAIADYPQKQRDLQAIAFTLKFMAKVLPSNDETTDAFKLLKDACDAAVGDNAGKFSGWWRTVERYTAGCTNADCKEFVSDIAMWLTAGLPAGDEQATYSGEAINGMSAETINELMAGVPSFGLDREVIAQLMKLLLPFLLQMLQSLFN